MAVLPLPPQASGLALLLARHLRFPSTWGEWEKLECAARYSPGKVMEGPPPGRR